jgi:hypothetical protein
MGEMDMAQAEKITSDKIQVTISDLRAALQFESSQMQKVNFTLTEFLNSFQGYQSSGNILRNNNNSVP